MKRLLFAYYKFYFVCLYFKKDKNLHGTKSSEQTSQDNNLTPLIWKNSYPKTLAEEETGIRVNKVPINNIRDTDDTVLLAKNVQDLQKRYKESVSTDIVINTEVLCGMTI